MNENKNIPMKEITIKDIKARTYMKRRYRTKYNNKIRSIGGETL